MKFNRLLAALALLFASAAQSAPSASQVMDWAERQFPALFPAHVADAALGPFIYRYYPSSGNYLGLAGDEIYIFGSVAAGSPVPVRVGRIADFACQVLPTSCAWPNFGGDAQHSAVSNVTATASLARVAWRTEVDLQPVYRPLRPGDADNTLVTGHYGSPVITPANTVIVPVRTSTAQTHRLEARSGADGSLKWVAPTDYSPPVSGLSYNAALTASGRVYFPGAGGKLFFRDNVDDGTSPAIAAIQQVVFYGNAAYQANRAAMDAALAINTPLVVDAAGTVYFGFQAAANPLGIEGGIARIDAAGNGSWVSAAVATGDNRMAKVPAGAAPAVSADGATVYVVMSSAPNAAKRSFGYVVALDSASLATRNKATLYDPATGSPEVLSDVSTASPAVGPDGDVYFGVLGDRTFGGRHFSHGWLLHFDATLGQRKVPGAFGWDMTPSFVSASLVGGYAGGSPYLIASKYNNYATGQHRMAILDPRNGQADASVPAVQVMREVMTILSPTRINASSTELHEWCINTAAVDPRTASVFMNASDGYLYRWRLSDNTLAQRLALNPGYFQSYTPTAIAPDGKVYTINNAVLNAVGP